MALNENKFVKAEGCFIAVKPNKSGNHLRFTVNEFGRTSRLEPVRTEKVGLEILKRMIAERPWCRDMIVARLREVKASKLLEEIGGNGGIGGKA